MTKSVQSFKTLEKILYRKLNVESFKNPQSFHQTLPNANQQAWKLKKWLCTKRHNAIKNSDLPHANNENLFQTLCSALVRPKMANRQPRRPQSPIRSMTPGAKTFEIISSMKFYANRETFFSLAKIEPGMVKAIASFSSGKLIGRDLCGSGI